MTDKELSGPKKMEDFKIKNAMNDLLGYEPKEVWLDTVEEAPKLKCGVCGNGWILETVNALRYNPETNQNERIYWKQYNYRSCEFCDNIIHPECGQYFGMGWMCNKCNPRRTIYSNNTSGY